jgi:hypothetical protein
VVPGRLDVMIRRRADLPGGFKRSNIGILGQRGIVSPLLHRLKSQWMADRLVRAIGDYRVPSPQGYLLGSTAEQYPELIYDHARMMHVHDIHRQIPGDSLSGFGPVGRKSCPAFRVRSQAQTLTGKRCACRSLRQPCGSSTMLGGR